MIRTRRVTPPTLGNDSPTAAPPPPVVQLSDEIMYKGYRIEPGSYSVGHGAWSPRVVVSVKTADGAWRPTPLYATSSARFQARDEADRRALEVAKTWIDAAVESRRASGG